MFKLLKHYIKLKIMTKYGEMAAYYYKTKYKDELIVDNIINKIGNINNNKPYLALEFIDLELIAWYSYSKVCNSKIIP